MAGINNPHVTALQRQHGITRSAAHAMWLADPKRRPWDAPDQSMHVECDHCGLFHHFNDDCPPMLPRVYGEEE